MAHYTQYKIVLVGDGNVGKTTWVKKLLTEEFEPKYVATLGVEVHPFHVNTNRGPIVFNIWDCAGVDKYGGLREGYYVKGDGAIVMCDITNQESEAHVEKWANDVNRVCSRNNSFPMVHVATKCDNGNFPPQYIGISIKSNFNLLTPLLELVRKIRNDPNLEFIL
jgi:GTP-binding nuclear protein Ran